MDLDMKSNYVKNVLFSINKKSVVLRQKSIMFRYCYPSCQYPTPLWASFLYIVRVNYTLSFTTRPLDHRLNYHQLLLAL